MIQYAGILDGSGAICVIRIPGLFGPPNNIRTTTAATAGTVSASCRPLQSQLVARAVAGGPDAGGPDGARADEALAAVRAALG
jgi:hypothetical protein